MLIELFGRNFGPFRDEFHLSMLAADIDPGSPRGVVDVPLADEDEPLRLVRCVGVYGPNASGKSWLLRASLALNRLIADSATTSSDESLPYEPFLLGNTVAVEPVMLGLRAVVDRRVYEYTVEFDARQFHREKLVHLGPDGETVLVERCDAEVVGRWTKDEQFQLLTKSFRPNALLLSLADRLAPALVGGLAVKIRRLLIQLELGWVPPAYGHAAVANRAIEDNPGFGRWLRDWLKAADVGIIDYDTRTVRTAQPEAQGPGESIQARGKKRLMLAFKHASARGPVELKDYQESLGTMRFVDLAPFIHDLTHGDEVRAYFIDEIGASIHPVLLRAVIQQFNCETPSQNVRGQLIFATHETLLFDAEARAAPLRRDQVYFTEKDASGASRLFSIAEFRERNNLNLRRRYLQGRYGALPAPGRFGA